MAKTTHQPPGKKGRLKRSKYTRENTTGNHTDRLDLLSVARGILKVYSVNSKIKSSKQQQTNRIVR